VLVLKSIGRVNGTGPLADAPVNCSGISGDDEASFGERGWASS